MEQVHHQPAGPAVQGPGGLVGQDDGRVVGHGPGDGHPLLLAAGELVGLVGQSLPHVHHLQQLPGPGGTLAGRDTGVHHGQLHVLLGVGPGDEVEILKDEADLPVADGGELVVPGLAYHSAVQVVGSLRGPVQHADDVHQRALPGAGGAHDGQKLPLLDVQVDTVENLQLVGRADVEALVDPPHPDDGPP